MRCDIVYNNLLASGYTSGSIIIKSDGKPWRPVVHVKDVCNAFIAVLEAPIQLVAGKAFNVGINNGNYTVRELAEAAKKNLEGCILKFAEENTTDERTYKVSFKRILNELNSYYRPSWDLENGGQEIIKFFKSVNFKSEFFSGRKCVRLEQLKHLSQKNIIDKNLRLI
jgi:nucleoside-diphosphate-sugar epimerase